MLPPLIQLGTYFIGRTEYPKLHDTKPVLPSKPEPAPTAPADMEGGYSDNPEFEALSDSLASTVFDISASNGRLWTLLKRQQLEQAVDLAADNRIRVRSIRGDIQRLGSWPDPEPAQQFTQDKITREFTIALAEFQRIQRSLAEKEREAETAAEAPQPQPEHDAEIELSAQVFEDPLRADEIAYQAGLVADREAEIQGIEQGIHELNDIFTSLSGVIQQQGTTLDNIEANIYNVRDDTSRGARELTRAARWQRSSTGRKMCLLVILLVVGVFIMLGIML